MNIVSLNTKNGKKNLLTTSIFLSTKTAKVTENSSTMVASMKKLIGIKRSDNYDVLVHTFAQICCVNYADKRLFTQTTASLA